ncbi:MAG: methylated-DNA-protein-cysteine methyltransferase-like protein [Myxococcota bacterium]|jgi:methylated-DNA-protein-cysteine methyltransferase-like protein
MQDLTAIRAAHRDGRLPWRAAVWAVVEHIPAGSVLGYKDVGAILGHPGRARHVGFALAALADPDTTPWWRVVRSDGSVAMQGDPERGPVQLHRLAAEGVELTPAGRIPMSRMRWDPWR